MQTLNGFIAGFETFDLKMRFGAKRFFIQLEALKLAPKIGILI